VAAATGCGSSNEPQQQQLAAVGATGRSGGNRPWRRSQVAAAATGRSGSDRPLHMTGCSRHLASAVNWLPQATGRCGRQAIRLSVASLGSAASA
jgi:hypothetical protein